MVHKEALWYITFSFVACFSLALINIKRDSFYEFGPNEIDTFIPEEWLDEPEIDGCIKNAEVSFKWKDQRWSNRKGRMWMKIIRKGEMVYEIAVDFFGLAPHKSKG